MSTRSYATVYNKKNCLVGNKPADAFGTLAQCTEVPHVGCPLGI